MSYDFGTTTVQEDYSRAAPPRRRRWVGLLATMVLIVVFVGGLWFAYSRGMQKGTAIADGGTPLFRADAGAVKVKPDQPGGMPVPGQDKLIYNPDRPENSVERLLPPPEQPMARPVAPPPAPVQATPSQAAAPAGAAPAGGQVAATTPAATAPIAAPVQAVDPVAPAVAPATKVQVAIAPPTAPTNLAIAPAVEAKPASPKVVEEKKPAEKAPTQVASLPPATLLPPASPKSILGVLQSVTGTRVQLGAVRSEQEAKQEWERLRRASGSLLSSTSVQISRADLGDKGVYYRIQTSPVADASKLCDDLKARKVACTVVR